MRDDDSSLDWDIRPEHLQAATETLARLLRMLGQQKKEPGALFGLHGLIGALLVTCSPYTVGEMVDLIQQYCADDALMDAIGEVLRDEGIVEDARDDAADTPPKDRPN